MAPLVRNLPNVLFLFQRKGVDIAGSYVAQQQRCVGGVQPKPYRVVSRIVNTLQIGNALRISTSDGNSKHAQIILKSQKVNRVAISRPRWKTRGPFVWRRPP